MNGGSCTSASPEKLQTSASSLKLQSTLFLDQGLPLWRAAGCAENQDSLPRAQAQDFPVEKNENPKSLCKEVHKKD
jgi:hypothetical protein